VRVAMDMWSGYPVARDRLLGAIAKHAPNRTVVISGDIHSSWANDLHAGFAHPDRPVIAAEFAGTSISSGGDGSDRGPQVTAATLSENPHVKWQSSRRGYVRCDVDADVWSTQFRSVAYVSRPGAPLQTPSKWRVERGKPGIQQV
jgi:alkaline phosphatase D